MAFEYLGYDVELDFSDERRVYSIDRANLRQVDDPFDLSQEEFRKNYRLSPDLTHWIVQSLDTHLRGTRVTAISSEKLVLATLRFYATGSYQCPVGEQWGISMSQPSISRAIHKVTDAINMTLLQQIVRFPMISIERQAAKTAFITTQYPFNGAIGAIDCTHVAILAPAEHEEAYVNHHGYHSINVQMVCDPSLKILNVNARYPGARHDAFIWSSSAARRAMNRAFDNGDHHAFLIGDAGYPLEPWLMTPLPNSTHGTPEFRYNEALCKSRNSVERLFGVLKATWRCLSRQRILMYKPGFAGKIVNACSVLHNLKLERREYYSEDLIYPELNNSTRNVDELPLSSHPPSMSAGKRVQNRLIQNFFLN